MLMSPSLALSFKDGPSIRQPVVGEDQIEAAVEIHNFKAEESEGPWLIS